MFYSTFIQVKKVLLQFLFLLIFVCCPSSIKGQAPLFDSSQYLLEQYGATIHIGYKYYDYPYRDSLLLLAKEAGMTFVRYDLDQRYTDIWKNAITSVKEKGLKSNIILSKWDYSYEGIRPWDNPNLYIKYLSQVVDSFKNEVDVWEVMNEVELINDNEGLWKNKKATIGYYSLVPLITNYIRKQSSNARIISGSIIGLDNPFVYQLFIRRIFSYFNVFNLHSYRAPEELPEIFSNIKLKMDKYNAHPNLWLTECGMSTNLDVLKKNTTEQLEIEQAHRVARIHLISFAYGVDKVFWYNLRSLENEQYNKEHHFGLLHQDLSPKPSYYAYKTLTSMCPGGSLRPTLRINHNVYLCSWIHPNGKHIWAIWSPKKRVRFSVNVKGRCQYYDYMGRSKRKPNYIDSGVTYMVGNKYTEVIF